MEEKKQVPQIRFKGYVDTWEQRKLGDIAVISSGIMGDSLLSDGDYRLTRIETIADGIVDESKIGYTNHKPDDNYLLQEGDILYSNINSISHMGKVAIYQGKSRLYHGINLLRLTSDNEVMSPYFLFYQLSTKPKRDWAKTHANQAVSQASINQTLLSEQGMSVCNIAEQKKISMFFSKLDNLITLHQRKYDKLVNIKKSMLEKMFPKNGRDVPEIRFRGFTEAWEQRKLGEVGKARSGIGFPDSEQGGAFGIPFFKVSDMNSDGNENEMTVANNYVTPTQITTHRWSPIEELPAIFFAKVGAAVMLNRKRLCRFPFLLDNNTMAYSLDCTKWNADFAKAIFETVDLTSLVQVGALPSYNAGDVEAMEIFLPSLPEQAYIGAYFKSLDNLITLHQRKLEKLKNIKKSMLDKMFV